MHQEQGAPLAGTGTVVMAEGRRLIRLGRELSSPIFDALINEYQRVTRDVMERMGGRQFEVFQDTAIAAFPTAKQAALAAAALQHVVATHEWPHKGDVAVSVGVHSGDVAIELGPATICCEALCDAAERARVTSAARPLCGRRRRRKALRPRRRAWSARAAAHVAALVGLLTTSRCRCSAGSQQGEEQARGAKSSSH